VKKNGKLSLVVFCLALAGGGWKLFDGHPVKAAAQQAATLAVPVTVAKVAQGAVPIELAGLGHVQAFNQVTVRPQVSGQIVKIAYKQGGLVQKGALLVQIDPSPFQAKLDQDNANERRDQASLANAELNLGRFVPLAREGYASAQQTDTQQSMVDQDRASIAADKAVIKQDEISLEDATVTSPITGIAGLHLIDVGNVVQPNDPTGMVTVTQVQPIAVLFTLPQSELPAVQAQVNQAAGRQLSVEAWSQDGGKDLGTGRLTVINNSVDATSGTITLRAVFTNESKMLWPGEFVQARLIIKTVGDGLTVPAPVVQRGPDGAYVWVVTSDDVAETRPVVVSQMVNGLMLISSGLTAGETVVTDGQYGLAPGTKVSIQDSSSDSPLQDAQTETLGIQP
jgi:membrane fusion protein, multidrug efflux system